MNAEPHKYQRRVIDRVLDLLQPELPAIAIEGPRAVGKTRTALERAETVVRLDDPAELELARSEPARLLEGKAPILIDEWQRLPEVWDLVRRAVDDGASPGSFILTGSAIRAKSPTHSGAGRITTVRMRPMTLAERGFQTRVSVSALLRDERPPITGSTAFALTDYVGEILDSGFPGVRTLSERSIRAQLDAYLSHVIEHDIPDDAGKLVRNPTALRRWMTAYAAAISTTTSFEKIRDAASPGNTQKPTKVTSLGYRDALAMVWLLDEIPAWSPTFNHLRRLAVAPKHQLADPALAARLLGLSSSALLENKIGGPLIPRDGTYLGALFESLATLSVRVFADAAEATTGHLRTRAGEQEVDLVVIRPDGRIIAIEIKLARTIDDADVRHLHWLEERIQDQMLDKVIITTGPEAYRRPDGVAVIPLALLGP
ncbi:MAG: AAA family ATPase [Solirubrobacterales bacterium]